MRGVPSVKRFRLTQFTTRHLLNDTRKRMLDPISVTAMIIGAGALLYYSTTTVLNIIPIE